MAQRYLIPKPIQRTYELFPGWGFTQAGIVLAGLIVGVIVFAGLTLFHLGPAPLHLIVAFFFIGIGGFLSFPPPNDQPLYLRLQAGIGFSRSQRIWLYDWNADDWNSNP